MKRRHFLALSALAPAVPFARAIPDPRSYLQAFCSVREIASREWLTAPFALSGHMGASDGRILIRTPVASSDGKCPFNEAVFEPLQARYLAPFRIGPVPALAEWVQCATCEKTGPQAQVPEWDEAFCYGCDNEGIKPNPFAELLTVSRDSLHRYWSQRQIAKILTLPGPVRFMLPENQVWSGSLGKQPAPMRFTWRHGDGLVMPLNNSPYVSERCQYQFEVEPA